MIGGRKGLASARVDASGKAEPNSDAVAGGPQLVDGVLMSHENVSEMVKCLDLLGVLAKQRGATLPAGLVRLHAELVALSTRATTRVAGRNVTAVLEFAHDEFGLVDTAQAAKILGIREDSVRDLCRRERLVRLRIDGRYWIAEESIRAYQAGRKGA